MGSLSKLWAWSFSRSSSANLSSFFLLIDSAFGNVHRYSILGFPHRFLHLLFSLFCHQAKYRPSVRPSVDIFDFCTNFFPLRGLRTEDGWDFGVPFPILRLMKSITRYGLWLMKFGRIFSVFRFFFSRCWCFPKKGLNVFCWISQIPIYLYPRISVTRWYAIHYSLLSPWQQIGGCLGILQVNLANLYVFDISFSCPWFPFLPLAP